MPINLSYREVRDLAKNLRNLTGREIKHTQILEAIARAVGRPVDSMMHELKNETSTITPAPSRTSESADADHLATSLGFSQSANGRRGRWVLRVLECSNVYPAAALDVVIEPTSDLRWPPVLDPSQPMWSVRVIHTHVGLNSEKLESVVTQAGEEGVSLHKALDIAFDFVGARHRLWADVDALDAVRDLEEISPLAAAEAARRLVRQSALKPTPHHELARSLGFDVIDILRQRKDKTMTPEDSKRIAREAGFEIWDTGGGCTAFAKLLREVATPGNDVASMDLMITIEGGCSVNAAPDQRVWGAGINYTDPRGGDSPIYTRDDTLTLEEAIAKAAEFEKEADRIWQEKYDPAAIADYEGFGDDEQDDEVVTP